MNDKSKPKDKKSAKTVVFGTSPVSSRGQLVIPAKLRKAQNIQPGDTLVFTGVPGSTYFTVLNANAFDGFTKDLHNLLEPDTKKEKKGQ
jgi:AbrB family looped-hinge helix DNA binding protein